MSSARATSSRFSSKADRTWPAHSSMQRGRRATRVHRARDRRRPPGPPAVEGEGVATIAEAFRAEATDVERIEDDVLVTARLKEW